MDKVAGFQYINAPVVSTLTPYSNSMDRNSLDRGSMEQRNPMIRGHHSSVGKAVEAHRQMVGERQSRNLVRREGMQAASEFSNSDLVAGQQVVDGSSSGSSASDDGEYPMYENSLIELPSTQAKMASIQSFQTSEPDRPVLGEPVPKGSYLDVEV